MRIGIGMLDLFEGGGAERGTIRLAGELACRGHDVILITFDSERSEPQYAVPPGVEILHFSSKSRASIPERLLLGGRAYLAIGRWARRAGVRLGPFRKLRGVRSWARRRTVVAPAIRRLMIERRLDCFIACKRSMIPHAVVAADRLPVRVFGSLHNDPEYDFGPDRRRVHRNPLDFFALYDVRGLRVQASEYIDWFPIELRRNVWNIPNEIEIGSDSGSLPNLSRSEVILTVGRLMEVKRIDLLIRAFARIAEKFPAAELHVYGEGPLYASLKELIEQLDLGNRARLCGYTQDIGEVYRRALAFCSASAAEGFPRALSEAMNSGLPCVVMEDCRGALLLTKGDKAALVAAVDENGGDLSEKLAAVLNDAQLRRRLSEAAQSRALEFVPGAVFDQWERMLCGGKESPQQVAILAEA